MVKEVEKKVEQLEEEAEKMEAYSTELVQLYL